MLLPLSLLFSERHFKADMMWIELIWMHITCIQHGVLGVVGRDEMPSTIHLTYERLSK